MNPEQAGKGCHRAIKYRKPPPRMNSQRLLDLKNVPMSASRRGSEKAQGGGNQGNRRRDLQAGEVSDGEHLCRGLIALHGPVL